MQFCIWVVGEILNRAFTLSKKNAAIPQKKHVYLEHPLPVQEAVPQLLKVNVHT